VVGLKSEIVRRLEVRYCPNDGGRAVRARAVVVTLWEKRATGRPLVASRDGAPATFEEVAQ
jgi:hypothetical protein